MGRTQDSYTSAAAYSYLEVVAANDRAAHIFSADDGYTLKTVKVKVYRAGSPGNVTMTVQGATLLGAAYYPNGSDAVTPKTFNGNAVTTSSAGEWVTVTFTDSCAITKGTRYSIVMSAASADGSNYIRWITDDGNQSHPDNTASSINGGASWAMYGNYGAMFEVQDTFMIPVDLTPNRKLVAIGNNEVWYEGSTAGTLIELSAANGDIDCTDQLTAVDGFDKLFIANGTKRKVIDWANTKIATANVGSNAPDRGNILTGGTSGATMVVDYITSTSSACTIYGKRTSTATFVAETVTGTDDDGNAVSFSTSGVETAPPHWYNWTVYGADTTNFGTAPTEAYLVWRYRGRIGWAGHKDYPHNWWLTKIGNPFDVKYDSTDPITAVAGQNANAGEVGDLIRAVIPFGDDFCVFGGANSIHVMNGDPAAGGSIDEVSNGIGFFSQWSWCIDNNGNLYFYGTDGKVYIMQGGATKPRCISDIHLPNLSTDWAANPSTHRVVVLFDPKRQGIVLMRTTLATGANTAYWYSLKTEGWYPESYPTDCGIFSAVFYPANSSTYRTTLVGCADGYIREWKDSAKDDDSGASDTAISSYFTCPIVPLAEDSDREGKLTSVSFDSAGGAASGDFSDTDGFSYELHVGPDPETTLEDIRDGATADASGTVTGTGRKSEDRSRVRGAYLGVKVYNSTAAQTFAVNKITAKAVPAGKVRV